MLEICVALIEELLVHFHEQFQCIVDEAMNGFVPMCFGIPIQGREHNRQNDSGVFGNQRHDVLVIPIV